MPAMHAVVVALRCYTPAPVAVSRLAGHQDRLKGLGSAELQQAALAVAA